MIILESVCEATADEFPARGPPDLLDLRLCLACNDRLFYSNLLNLGRREFDRPCDAIAHVFPARGPLDVLLLGLRLACIRRLFEGNLGSAGCRRALRRGRSKGSTANKYSSDNADT